MCFEVNLRIDVLKKFHNVQGWLGGNLIITSERLPPGINWEKIILLGFLKRLNMFWGQYIIY